LYRTRAAAPPQGSTPVADGREGQFLADGSPKTAVGYRP